MCTKKLKIIKHPKKLYTCYLCKENIESNHIHATYFINNTIIQYRFHEDCKNFLEKMCLDCSLPYGRCMMDPFHCFKIKYKKD